MTFWMFHQHYTCSDGLDYFRLYADFATAKSAYDAVLLKMTQMNELELDSDNGTSRPPYFQQLTDGDYIALFSITVDNGSARSRP
jgi:hypothetical protein